jgi:hemoglobin
MIAVTVRALAAASLLLALTSAALAQSSLYERLGGGAGVSSIASDLVDRASTDPRTAAQFRDSNLARVKTKLAELLCELSGGPCHYSGDSMKETHAGHHISQAEFYELVENLRSVLRAHQVSMGATNQLLKLLAPMKRDIVEPPATGPRS